MFDDGAVDSVLKHWVCYAQNRPSISIGYLIRPNEPTLT